MSWSTDYSFRESNDIRGFSVGERRDDDCEHSFQFECKKFQFSELRRVCTVYAIHHLLKYS